MSIPFNLKSSAGNELNYLQSCFNNLRPSGFYNQYATDLLINCSKGAECLLVSSCTSALEIMANLLSLSSSDEVIVPAYGFISAASAFAKKPCKIVFCDSRLDTATICMDQLKLTVTSKTRAVCIVNYNGYGEDLAAISEYCREKNIFFMEDNAHGFGVINKGKALGTFGFASATSFGAQKNISCGEGGALFLQDSSLLSEAFDISNYGANLSDFKTGRVSHYTWSKLGSNYKLSEFAAAILCAQLEEFNAIIAHRKQLWHNYASSLMGWAYNNGIDIPPAHYQQSYHIFWLVFSEEEESFRFRLHMKTFSIEVLPHYQPLNTSAMGRSLQSKNISDCPNALKLSKTLVRLPLNNAMSKTDQSIIISAVLSFGSTQCS